jgi:predicted component of type VI protein secretion system
MNDSAGVDTSATPARAPCPHCGSERAGRDRYCEPCGFDFLAPAARGWSAVIAPDPEQFARTAPAGLSFPAVPAAPRSVALVASPVRIGRSQADIDIGDDPAVSRLHASLVRQDDHTWAIVDEGSSNGVTINEDERAIAPHTLVALHDGDRVHLGAWTTIVVAAPG